MHETPENATPKDGRRSMRVFAGLATALAALLLVPVVWAVGGNDKPLPDGAAAVEGVLSTWHGDGTSAVTGEGAELQTASGVVPVKMEMAEARRLAGKRVRVHGQMKAGVLVADAGTAATTVIADATVAAAAPKTVAVILVNFTNNTSQPWTADAVENTVLDANLDNPSSVRAYYEESSDGAVTITGKVFGWYQVNDTDAACDYRNWATLAKAAASTQATAAGMDLNSSSVYKVYVFPRTPDCGWAGLGELPGDEAWIDGYAQLRTIAHELGHNFGVHHASTASCTLPGGSRTAITARIADDCAVSEYGDPFTIMGGSTRSHHAWMRSQLGYPVGTQTVTLTAGYDATHTITALEPGAGSTAVRLLRLARGTTGTFLDLELRGISGPIDGFGATDPAVTGVSARIGFANTSRIQSQLIDSTLGTSSFADAPFQPGTSLWDPVSGARVTVVSVSGGVATVRVQYDPDLGAPTAPGGLTGNGTAGTLPSVSLSWTAASDDRQLAGYEIRRNGARVGVSHGLTYTDACVAGQTCGLAVSNTYTYDVYAYDASGKLSPKATVSVLIPGSDTVAPSVPGTPSVTDVTAGSVALSWAASTDNVGGSGIGGYEVWRGTTLAGTTTGTTYTDTALTPATAYSYTVKAFDVQNNRSAASGATGATTEPAPAATSVVSTSLSGATVTVTYARADAYAGYEVRRELYDSRKRTWGSATTVATAGVCATATCAVTNGLPKTGTYRYSVRSTNGSLASAWSAPSASVVYSRR